MKLDKNVLISYYISFSVISLGKLLWEFAMTYFTIYLIRMLSFEIFFLSGRDDMGSNIFIKLRY